MSLSVSVLLVDDESEFLENICFDLREYVGRFIMAKNGKEALEKYAEHKHDITCIITDIKMPIMNGIEFIKEVREQDPDIPVIFLTAYGDEEQMKKALSLNVSDFISKPYDVFELQEFFLNLHTDNFDKFESLLSQVG